MAFQKTTVLTTRETVFGPRWLGQIVAVPTGRLDKVSLYLEPNIADPVAAQSISVLVEIFDVSPGYPSGLPLASDFIPLSDIAVRGFQNFRTEGYVPTIVGIVLRVPGGDANNNVSWRYVSVSSGGNELLISADDGANWTIDPTRKFSYKTFSLIANAVDSDQQTAAVSAGSLQSITDNTGAEFSLGELDRTAVVGNTVAINFGDFVVTLVVDQSGSMTWNDNNGLRFDFLEQFATDVDASLATFSPSSTVTFSLIRFRGRRVGSLQIGVEGAQSGLHLDGIRIVRKAGSPPTSITDGCVVFEGLAQEFLDEGVCSALVPGTTYYYAAFAFATLGGNTLFSPPLDDFADIQSPPTPPFSVARFTGSIAVTDSGGTPIVPNFPSVVDFGFRKVVLNWLNPSGFNYTNVTIVRRDDRPPTSPIDGNVLLANAPAATLTFTDTFAGTYEFVNDLTYHYRIFTTNALGIKCPLDNALKVDVLIPATPRPWELLEPPANIPPFGFDVTPPGPPLLTVTPSNGEIQLSWTPADIDTRRYKLYFDASQFPVPTDDKGREYTGTLLFDGTGTNFIHRFQTNGQPNFYSLIALDMVENASTPVQPLIAGNPPKPSASAVVFFPPDPVSNFEVQVVNTSTTRITWVNPVAPASATGNFFFGDQVRIFATVEFLDPGNSQNFLTFDFVEGVRNIGLYDAANPVDPKVAIAFSHVQSITPSTILAVVAVTPLLDLQNLMSTASITIGAALKVVNRDTGAVIAQISTPSINLNFMNPFDIEIENSPPQGVSRRSWGPDPNAEPGLPCQTRSYQTTSLPGVYVGSNQGFNALVSATFRGQALGAPMSVDLSLLDSAGNPTTLAVLPNTGGQTFATLATSDVVDELLDRSGEPTGATTIRSLLPVTLAPATVPGDFILQATGNFNGYIKTVQLGVHYEPTLNVDLTLIPFNPDNVDTAQQSAYVYFGPFDAPQSQKIPVADFTVTNWTITPLCIPSIKFDLRSEDNVPGVGINSYTRGGLAQKIFWGPGEIDSAEQDYEVHVKVQNGGQTSDGFGMLTLSSPVTDPANKIFLRNVANFSEEDIFSDGAALSTWEVIARPEDDAGSGPGDPESGQAFRNAVVGQGGNVPSLDDGRIVTLQVKANNVSDPDNHGTTGQEFANIVSSIRVHTNLTGPNGRAGSAKAQIVNGKATFQISVDARVPPPKKDQFSQQDIEENLFYSIYGLMFQLPNTGLYLTLTAYTTIEVNGKPVSFFGGGASLTTSAPPCFIGLIEPLTPA